MSPRDRATRSAGAGQAGFTLVELVLAIAILAFMMMVAWSVISGTVFARKNLAERQDRDHELRVATAVMVRDLSSAYLSSNEDQNMTERRTLFVGKPNGDVDELRFSTMAHRVLWADANESEQTVITYSAEADPDKPSTVNLVRREQRRPSNEPSREERAELDVLLSDIEKVKFEYWDWRAKEWMEDWDSTQADGERGRLPTRVRILIELKTAGEGSDTVKYQTEARLMLQEELKFFTN
ncbi:MAG TPA: type II secretion system protein GspJ [Kofleriaceae bacterium]|nr:type II secretion system protein GspJ [Kofleriaceae bacterium]